MSDLDVNQAEELDRKTIELSNVTKQYGKKKVLDGVSYSALRGSVFALLGENGAGKTTTIRMLLGETEPTSGRVDVFGRNPRKDVAALRARIGFVPETPILYDYMTIVEMGRFAAAFYPKGYLEEYAKRCEEFNLSPYDKIKNISKGMKAKVSLALALSHNPELLVLDEPTSGLDALVRRQFLANIADFAAAGGTVFLSSHQTTEIERVADQIAFLKNGKAIVVDSLDNLMATTQILAATIVGQNDTDERLDELFRTIFDEFVGVERYGTRRRILGRGLAQDHEKKLQDSLGERLIETQRLRPTLEDVFVGYMTAKKQ